MENYSEEFEKEHHHQKYFFVKVIGVTVVSILSIIIAVYLEMVQVRGKFVLINCKVVDQHYRENDNNLAPEIFFSVELDNGDLVLVRTNTLTRFHQGKRAKLKLSKSFLFGRSRYDFAGYVKEPPSSLKPH
ncbi:MAG: hypothetical protein K8S27_09785 [Candidatus Omnitrophica bacterium]|nr:hypothetical protein [Candidatus Omnitrophota bacterium]